MKRFLGTLLVIIVLASIANRYVPLFPRLQSLVQTSWDTQRSCRIKGNIAMSGERIYHVPGAPYYYATRIDTARGERWFCSEAEARAAGWRKSKAY